MNNIVEFEIRGQLQGSIWMPPVIATLEIEGSFNQVGNAFHYKWEGIRAALETLISHSDGDFQSCELSYAFIKIIRRITNNTIQETYKELNRHAPIIADLFCGDYEVVYPGIE